jgi:hypothetical protein
VIALERFENVKVCPPTTSTPLAMLKLGETPGKRHDPTLTPEADVAPGQEIDGVYPIIFQPLSCRP